MLPKAQEQEQERGPRQIDPRTRGTGKRVPDKPQPEPVAAVGEAQPDETKESE